MFNKLKRLFNPKHSGRRGWNGAANNRLTLDWVFSGISSHEAVKADWLTLVMRARELAKSNPYAHKYLEMVCKNVVGRGFLLNVSPMDANGRIDRPAAELIESAWRKWGENPAYVDMSGRKTWLDAQLSFIRNTARDGEPLVRMVRGANNPYGFALKFYDCRVLDVDLNEAPRGGNQIIMGVEIDTWGRPVAYHLKRTSDNSTNTRYTQNNHERIPADEIIHWGIEEYEDQVRYITWMAAGMANCQHLGKYEEAELIASRMAAAKTGFLIQKEGPDYEPDDEDASGKFSMKAEPGEIQLLPPGWDYRGNDPQHPTSAYPSARKSFMQGIASGFGVAYNGLANDLEGVNFSSIRSGVLDERDGWMLIQEQMIQHFCRPVFAAWLRMAMLTGAVPLPLSKYPKFKADHWIGRRWQWVDPKKDAETNEIMVAHGWKTNTQITSELGYDYEDNIERLNSEPKPASSDADQPAQEVEA